MKIKLVEPGWETFSDYLGFVLFKDGESVEDVSPAEAARLASIVRIETLEGRNPSPAQMILDNWSGPMIVATTDTADAAKAASPAAPAKSWTQEELSAIADERGIKGLREIGDDLGLKGTGIADLIAKIVEATKGVAAVESAPAQETPAAE